MKNNCNFIVNLAIFLHFCKILNTRNKNRIFCSLIIFTFISQLLVELRSNTSRITPIFSLYLLMDNIWLRSISVLLTLIKKLEIQAAFVAVSVKCNLILTDKRRMIKENISVWLCKNEDYKVSKKLF